MAATLPSDLKIDENAVMGDEVSKEKCQTEVAPTPVPTSSSTDHEEEKRGFLLIDDKETLKVTTTEDFTNKLGCQGQVSLKVVSVFGNTGDGKSYTLNHTFFNGKEVFKTSASQLSCTVGVWASYDAVNHTVILDTEGLLGMSRNQNQRTRLLLKVLAISDVVIYRTSAERLHTDMFTFLGDASDAYQLHFTKELRDVTQRGKMDVPLCSLGPVVIIFHETQHTSLLGTCDKETDGDVTKTADDILKERFAEVGRVPQAFSSIQYIGTQTSSPPTDFSGLVTATRACLTNNSVRSARAPAVILKSLMLLNEKFSGDIEKTIPSTFPDAYFTCQAICPSCCNRCQQSINHERDNTRHACESRCQYQAQFDNRIFTCKACYHRGKQSVVVPKMCSSAEQSWIGFATYAWSGYVLECCDCGVIFRSRQYWYGNQDPVDTVVRTEIRHVWPGENVKPQDTSNAARRVLDGVNFLTQTVSSIAPPTRAVSDWFADKVAPDYWVPNSEIALCQSCQHLFSDKEQKHHCRACGGGFCDACSTNKKPVPGRGWGFTPVRVCDTCFTKDHAVDLEPQPACNLGELSDALDEKSAPQVSVSVGEDSASLIDPLTARKVTEVVQSAVGVISTAIDYPKVLITDAARPGYWVPDSEITNCHGCRSEFKSEKKHHCRACGKGFCGACSQAKRAVPSRGWDHPVRVCDKCANSNGQL